MANVNIELGYKNLAWFNANPTIVLLEGQIVYLEQTGTYKIGDGISALNTLSFLGISSETQTLQNVTDLGNTTTNSINANSFITNGGLNNQFVKGDGSLDNNVYITLADVPNFTSVLKHQVKTSIAVTKGQAVYVSDANGTNMIVSKASNTAESTSSKTMGLVSQDLAINEIGYIITEGLLSGLNTSTATIGDPVWLGLNGNLIYGLTNKPYAPAHLVFIGIVTRVNSNNGEIFVKVQNGFELKEIHDVDLITTTPVNGHVLGYNGTLWVNKTIASWLGFTPYNSTNPAGYISGINSSMVTTALGFTPYNATNPNGYITSSALTPYAPLSNPTFTTAITTPVINGVSSLVQFNSAHNINIGTANTTGQRILRVGQGTGWVDIGNASDGTGNGFISFNQTTNTLANSALYGGAFSTVVNSNNQVFIRLGNGNQIAVNITNHIFTPSSASSGAIIPFTFTVPTNTNQTLSTNTPNFKVTGASKQFATGALASQYFNHFSANTLSFVGASTASEVFNSYFEVTTAGTNATITKNYAAGFGGDIKVAGNVNTYIDGGYNLYNAAGNQFIGSILRGSDASLLIEAAMVNLKLGAGGSAGDVLIYTSNTSKSIRLSSTIGTYIGSNLTTTPTARLHIGAGTATAGTAPLKLTSGTNLTTPENGAFEYDGTNLYFTTGGVRKMVTLI